MRYINRMGGGIVFLFLCFFFCTCKTVKTFHIPESFETVPYEKYEALEDKFKKNILDWEGKEKGTVVPAWLEAYLKGGEAEIEKIALYNDDYCFVLKVSSMNLNILRTRLAVFSAEREFPYMAYLRVFNFFLKNTQESPDLVYGSALKRLVRRIISAKWSGVKTRSSFYLLLRFSADIEDAQPVQEQSYTLYVLVTISKTEFETQLNNAVNETINEPVTDTPEQVQSFKDMASNIYDDF